MLQLKMENSFKKDLKKIQKRNLNLTLLQKTIDLLLTGEPLPEEYGDHKLTNNWKGHRECHIAPDWLLVYKVDKKKLVLVLCYTGTHSDIF